MRGDKGRNGRCNTRLIEAKRSAARCGINTAHLHPQSHRKLVEAIRAGSEIAASIITSGLTDKEAYRLESKMIADYHNSQTGQLWNTIDERFMERRLLPRDWHNPENHLYKLPRPIIRPS
jgi:hypothetical protein